MDENPYKSEDGPVLLYNNSIQGIKVHSSLVNEMRTCDAFDFSVAFITTDCPPCMIPSGIFPRER